MKYKLSNNSNGLLKLIQNNDKHNTARFQAAAIIIQRFQNKSEKSSLSNAFKIVAYYTISLATFLHKTPFPEKELSSSMMHNENFTSSSFNPSLTPPTHNQFSKSKGNNLSFGGNNNSLTINQSQSNTIQTSYSQMPISNTNLSQNIENSTPNQNRYFGASTGSSFKKSLPLPVGVLKDLQSYKSQQSLINSASNSQYNSSFQSRENSPSKNILLPPTNKSLIQLNLQKEKEKAHSYIPNSNSNLNISNEMGIINGQMSAATFGIHSAHNKSVSSMFQSERSPCNENKTLKEIPSLVTSPLKLTTFPSYLQGRGSGQDSAKSRDSDNLFSKYAKLYKEGDNHSSISSLASSVILSTQQVQNQSKSPKKISFIQYRTTEGTLKGEERSLNEGNKLSEKTKRFLEDIDLNRYNGQNGKRSQRTNRKNEVLNKSDNAIRMKDENENFDQNNYSSVNVSVNLNKRTLLNY